MKKGGTNGGLEPIDREHHTPLPKSVAVAGEATGGEYLYRPGELLTTAADAKRVAAALKALGLNGRREQTEDLGLVRFRVARAPEGPELLAAVRAQLGDQPAALKPNHVLFFPSHIKWVAGAEPPVPADPRDRPSGTNLPGTGVTVGVVDTGVVSRHAFLAGRVNAGPGDGEVPDANGDNVLDIDAGHGTFVCGLILEVAPGASVIMRRAETDGGVTDEWTVARAIRSLAGVDVLNLSLGAYTEGDAPPLALATALQQVWATNPQTVVVAGAGNDGWDRPFYPAALKQVVAVGATDSAMNPAPFSNRGWWVDACAVGVNVDSSFFEWGDFKGWAAWSGTSFAAARVTGAVAAATGSPSAAAHALMDAPGVQRIADFGTFVPAHVVT